MPRPSEDLQDLALVARDDAIHDAIGGVKDLFCDEQAPGHDPASPLSREMEVAVFKHHGRAGDWPDAASAAASASDQAVASHAV